MALPCSSQMRASLLPVHVLDDPNASRAFRHRQNESIGGQSDLHVNEIRHKHVGSVLKVGHSNWLAQGACRWPARTAPSIRSRIRYGLRQNR